MNEIGQAFLFGMLNGILSMDYPFTEEASTDEDKMESEVVLNFVKALKFWMISQGVCENGKEKGNPSD